ARGAAVLAHLPIIGGGPCRGRIAVCRRSGKAVAISGLMALRIRQSRHFLFDRLCRQVRSVITRGGLAGLGIDRGIGRIVSGSTGGRARTQTRLEASSRAVLASVSLLGLFDGRLIAERCSGVAFL